VSPYNTSAGAGAGAGSGAFSLDYGGSDNSKGFVSDDTTLDSRKNRFLTTTSNKKAKDSKYGSDYFLDDTYMGGGVINGGASGTVYTEDDFINMTVVGTCEVLPKEFFRLTAPPRPSDVRPVKVLKKWLTELMEKSREGRGGKVEYAYLCSQFKAIRQDLTVQRIEDYFTVTVYENAARICLENKDVNEFNMCQTQLKELYSKVERKLKLDMTKLEGDALQAVVAKASIALRNRSEFCAYRLLYLTYLKLNNKLSSDSEVSSILAEISSSSFSDLVEVKHALDVREAVFCNNYHKFFILYERTDVKMSPYIMDHMLDSIRYKALHLCIKAYKPTISKMFLLEELGFAGEDEEGTAWLINRGCVIYDNDSGEQFVDTGKTVVHDYVEKSGKGDLM
jgi:hypothetical protein